ncbi:MAG: YraN family protein [Desulfobulbaceae bacterium]|nr:YraN family protein [Desulfobulbaceae bacterium]
MSRERLTLGDRGEELAVGHLRKLGYRILCRNYRRREGEIDIVAEDGAVLVFVEVKTRSGVSCGDPLEAVTPRKRGQIARTAMRYLAENDCHDRPARFDVLGVTIPEGGTYSLQLVRDAFSLDMDG